MKSFYTVNELGDVTINLSFTLPTFLGLGDEKMTKALVKIDCFNVPVSVTPQHTIEKTVTVSAGDKGKTKNLRIPGIDFVYSQVVGTLSTSKSGLQHDGKLEISIYSNSTSGELLVGPKPISIDLEEFAVAEEAPESGFMGVDLETEGITGDKSASVKIKIPCNKIYNQSFRSVDDGSYPRIIFINHETMANRYHIMFISDWYEPGEATTLSFINAGYFVVSAYTDKSTVTLFKTEENKYIIRVGEYSGEETLKTDHDIIYISEGGDYMTQPFYAILGLGGTNYVHEITPIDCP